MENTLHLNLSGFPGAGKTTIAKKIMEIHSTIIIPKVTTRPRRPTENGGEYVFISMEEFQQRNKNGDFIAVEPNIIDGVIHYYAIPKEKFWPEVPKTAELVLSLFGIYAKTVKEYVPKMKLGFVTYKNMEILKERLRTRCLEDGSNFQEKMKLIEQYLQSNIQDGYDYPLYNDGTIGETLKQVETLIKKNGY